MRRGLFTVKSAAVAAPAYIGAGAPSAFTSGNITRPTVAAGDLMICVLLANAAVAVSAAPSGWTQVGTPTTSSSYGIDVWYKIATGSEPANYTWTTGANTVATIVAYSGVTGVRSHADSVNGFTTTVTFASVTPLAADCLVAIACKSDSETLTVPTGYVERLDETGVSGPRGVFLADDTVAAAGATGAVTCTQTVGSQTATKHLVLIPA